MMKVEIDKEFSEVLQQSIKELYTETIEDARRSAGVNIEYLSKQQTMKHFDVGNTTLMNEWVPDGLSYSRIGGKIYFKRSDVHEFIERHKVV